jgi:hypothetical protein
MTKNKNCSLTDLPTADRTKAIAENMDGLYNFSPLATEPYFSKMACETCGTKLYGNRHDFSATIGKRHDCRRQIVSCCVDCFMYLFC